MGNYRAGTSPTFSFGQSAGMPSYGYNGGGQGAAMDWGKIAKGVGGWLGKNPDVAIAAGATALGYLGDRSAQKSAEKQQVVANSQWGEENALNERQVALNEQEYRAKLEADQAEHSRRRAAILRVLGMDRTPIQMGS